MSRLGRALSVRQLEREPNLGRWKRSQTEHVHTYTRCLQAAWRFMTKCNNLLCSQRKAKYRRGLQQMEGLASLSSWLTMHFNGFYVLAGALAGVTIFAGVISAKMSWDETERRRQEERELRAVEIAQWLLVDVNRVVQEIEGMLDFPPESLEEAMQTLGGQHPEVIKMRLQLNTRRLIRSRGPFPGLHDLDDLLKSRGFARAQVEEILAPERTRAMFTSVLNMLELFSAKAHVAHNQDITYRYCAPYYCMCVEKFAPLIMWFRKSQDREFFSTGAELYERWSARMEDESRRPSKPMAENTEV